MALLLSSFGTDKLNNEKNNETETNRIPEALNRIRDFMRLLISRTIRKEEKTKLPQIEKSDKIGVKKINCDDNSTRTNDKIFRKEKNSSLKIIKIKKLAFNLVEHRFFEIFLIILIVLSSMFLVS